MGHNLFQIACHDIFIVNLILFRNIFNIKSLRFDQILFLILLFGELSVDKHLVIHLLLSLLLHFVSHSSHTVFLGINREIAAFSIVFHFTLFVFIGLLLRFNLLTSIGISLIANVFKALISDLVPKLSAELQLFIIAVNSTGCNNTHLLSEFRFSFQDLFFLLSALLLFLNSV